MHVRRGDTVVVISGADKTKQGKVLKVDPKKGRIKVEGIRVITRHVKPSQQQNTQKGRIDKHEAYFPACKVMLVDPKTGKPTRVSIQVIDGRTVRVSKDSGTVIEARP